MPKCRVCGHEAWVKIPWGNTWFCKEHFTEYFERKVWRTYRKYVPRGHRKVLFTVSGGKDSIALLHSLAPQLINEGYEVSALFIDLGIKGYSEYARKVVEENVNELKINLIIYDLGEHEGFTIDELANAVKTRVFKKPVCSLCGVVKRYIYNYIAYRQGYDLVLTGHNLDDVYGFILSNLTIGNLDDLVKLQPYTPGDKYFVAKAKPLFFNYERENRLYIIAKELKIVTHKCPYAPVKEESLVTSYKKLLHELEKKHPGIGLMFVKHFIKDVSPYIKREKASERKIVKCSICGMPSSTNPCSFCRIKLKLGKISVKNDE